MEAHENLPYQNFSDDGPSVPSRLPIALHQWYHDWMDVRCIEELVLEKFANVAAPCIRFFINATLR